MADCENTALGRRRRFWATQTDACGQDVDGCQNTCGRPGLSFLDTAEGRTIETSGYINGLVMNMLMTDGKQLDRTCGYAPGAQGGHWSESYIEVGQATAGASDIGTLIRSIAPSGSIDEIRSILQAHAEATLARLITRGVALRVDTSVTYQGDGIFAVDVEIFGIDNTLARVGLSAARLEQGWIWAGEQ